MEVVVAAAILVVGLAGTLGVVMGSNNSTTAVTNTEGGTNLAREVIERVRELPASQVTPGTVATTLQGMSGLANTNAGAPGTWTVSRRGTTYTLTVDVCSVDDPKDGSGSHGGATFCANGGAAGTADTQPQDYVRVTTDVTWTAKSGQTRHVTQTSIISGRGADGPSVTDLRATNPGSPTIANPVAPILSSTTTTAITFTLTADARAAHVYMLVDGSPVGQATSGAGNTWTYTLDVTPANRPHK